MKKILITLVIFAIAPLYAMEPSHKMKMHASASKTLAQAAPDRKNFSITVTAMGAMKRSFTVPPAGSDTFAVVKKKVYDKMAELRMRETPDNPFPEPIEPSEQALVEVQGYGIGHVIEDVDSLIKAHDIYVQPSWMQKK